MNDISRIGYNIGTLLSIDNILRFAKKIEEKENIPADVLNPGIVGINFSVPA